MSRPGWVLLVVTAVAAGAGVFLITTRSEAQQSRPWPSAEARVLDLTAGQAASLRDAQAAFRAESAVLSQRLAAERKELISKLEDVSTPNAAIREQIERVIGAHNTLERRVADYLLDVRPHLSVDQQKRVLNLMADCVRQGARWRWRHGRTRGQDTHGDQGRGGQGGGRRRGWRGGR